MLGYRTTFEIDLDRSVGISREDAVRVLLGDAFNWIRHKKGVREIDALEPWKESPLSNGGSAIFGTGTTPAGDEYGKFVYFDPPQKSGQWVTTFLVGLSPKNPHRASVSVELDVPENLETPGKPCFANRPYLVKNVLDSYTCYDMSVEISDDPIRVQDEARLESFLDALEDPRRRGLIIACGTDDTVDESAWWGIFDDITSECSGQASVFLLDTAMTSRYNESARVSRRHQLRPYSIRTFKPGARLDEPDDGIRHRFLAPRTLLTMRRKDLTDLYGRLCRAHGLSLPQDRYIRRLDAFASAELDHATFRSHHPFKTEHVADTIPTESAVRPDLRMNAPQGSNGTPLSAPVAIFTSEEKGSPTSLPASVGGLERENAQLRAENESASMRVAELLGRLDELRRGLVEQEAKFDVLLEARLAEQGRRDLERFQNQLDALDDERRKLEKERETAYEEVEFKNLELEEASPLRRTLEYRLECARKILREHRLDESSTHGEAVDPYKDIEINTWEELRFFGEVFENLTLPLEWKPTFELESQPESNAWLSTTLEILKTLDDYAAFKKTEEGKAFNGDLRQYLSNSASAGRHTFPPARYRANESQTTKGKWGAERRFPVPSFVEKSGNILMHKHVEIQTRGPISPRLYFEDRTADLGKIVVGYIGPHLTNTKTC